MKVISLIGSERTNSLSLKINNVVLNELKKNYDEFESVIFTKDIFPINDCQGCRSCFTSQKCLQDTKDNFQVLRKGLLEADLIILGFPVFLNNVSGYMKSFLDRIAYWTHIYKLKGKLVLPIIITDSSGNVPVSIYVNSIFTALGMKIVGTINVVKIIFNKQELNRQINYAIHNIYHDEYENKADLEEYYAKLKGVYLSDKPLLSDNERRYFMEKGYLECDSYEELLKKN